MKNDAKKKLTIKKRKPVTKKNRKNMTTETKQRVENVPEPVKKYNKAQFELAVGLSPNAIYNLIKTGKIAKKKVYTQKDVDKYLENTGKTDPEKLKAAAHVSGVSARDKKYNISQIADKLGYDKSYLYHLRKQGKLVYKDEYSETDFQAIKSYLSSHKRVDRAGKPDTIKKEALFDDEITFEIHKNVDEDARQNLRVTSLINFMKNFKAPSAHGVFVPLKMFGTRAKLNEAVLQATEQIVKENGFENSVWKVQQFKNQDKVFTGLDIIRKS